MNMRVQIPLWDHVFISCGYTPGSGIAESCGSSSFRFLRKLYTVFHSGCTSLHFHQQCITIPFSPTSLTTFIPCVFDDTHSSRCEVTHHVVLTCISQKISDVKHFFTYLLAIWTSLEKCLQFLHPFLSQIVFLLLRCMSSLHILNINPLEYIWFVSIFSHAIGCLFILLVVSWAVQKLCSLMQSHLFLLLLPWLFGVKSKKLSRPMSRSSPTTYSSKSFTVSGLTLKSLIHTVSWSLL